MPCRPAPPLIRDLIAPRLQRWILLACIALGTDSIARSAHADAVQGWIEQQPFTSYGTRIVFDPVDERLLILGHESRIAGRSMVWSFVPVSGDFSELEAPGEAPSPIEVQRGATLYDSRNNRVLVASPGTTWDSPYLYALWLSPAPRWERLSLPYMGLGYGASVVFDSRANRLIVFGGAVGLRGDTYVNSLMTISLDSLVWHPVGLAADTPLPIGRAWHSAVFDSVRNRMLVFGGKSYAPRSSNVIDVDETWELSLDGEPAWRFLTPLTTVPSARYGHGAVEDASRGRMIIYGGDGTGGMLSDGWSLALNDTTGARWTGITSGSIPGARSGPALAIDPAQGDLFMYGGSKSEGGTEYFQNSLWVLLGNYGGWRDRTPWGSTPAPTDPTLAYDSTNGAVWLLQPNVTLTQVWRYADQQWNPDFPPRGLSSHYSLVWDPVRSRLILFGGYAVTGQIVNETWVLDGTSWQQLSTSNPPPARNSANAVYDPIGDRLIVFGGGDAHDDRFGDVWALPLTGSPDWTMLAPTGSGPVGRAQAAMIDDVARNRLVIAGGIDTIGPRSDTWAFDLGTNHWTKLPVTSPVPIHDTAAGYRSSDDRMLVLGGTGSLSLDLAHGTAWIQAVSNYRSPSLIGSSTAYDSRLDRIVLVGHDYYQNTSQTWAYYFDAATPVLASLISASVENGHALLAWDLGAAGVQATIYRSEATDPWTTLATMSADGTGRIVYTDARVHPGTIYRYRLGLADPNGERFMGEALIEIPLLPRFALEGATPNPGTSRRLIIAFTLPSAVPATLDVVDVAGRRIVHRAVGTQGPGRHVTTLDRLEPGLYFIRLSQGAEVRTVRAAVVS